MPIVGNTTPQMNAPMTPVTKSHRGTMLGLPVEVVNEWANRAYIIFGVIAIGATALALIASFFIWRTGAVLSRISDEKIAFAQKSAGEANERAASLEAQAAEALLRQEQIKASNLELQNTIEKEREGRLKLEARVAWRRIRTGQVEGAQNFLARHPSNINLSFIAGDPETRFYIDQISDVFMNAGWQIHLSAPLVAEKLDNKNLLEEKHNVETDYVKSALSDLGVQFEMIPKIPESVSIGSIDPNAEVSLLITPRVPE